MKKYIISIDQSTQGTKVLLFDTEGKPICRLDKPHRQMVNEKGWVEHDPEEIWKNLRELIEELKRKSGFSAEEVAAVGISNQRETAMAWNRATGKPVYPAIVWQCARGAAICTKLEREGFSDLVREHTGIPLSPYFSAAKLAWILQNVPEAGRLMDAGQLGMGTMDSWLVYRMTGGKEYRTDYSNASRTQLFNIHRLAWDEEICKLFGIDVSALPEVTDSDGEYGETDFDGVLEAKVPIRAVFGDSHAALYGQGCHKPGMTKATYGTGSSVMMNTGSRPAASKSGLATSLAWGLSGKVDYVLEGNINYTGASITWLKDELQLIDSPKETEALAEAANPADRSYFVPAFTGLGAPYWDSEARGLFTGITRTTGKKEIVRAVLNSIAYQISDIVLRMRQESGHELPALRVDGGPTRNGCLMQFQTDILDCPVDVPEAEELSAIGAAYCAGIASGLYDMSVFGRMKRKTYQSKMSAEQRQELLSGWQQAVRRTLWHE